MIGAHLSAITVKTHLSKLLVTVPPSRKLGTRYARFAGPGGVNVWALYLEITIAADSAVFVFDLVILLLLLLPGNHGHPEIW